MGLANGNEAWGRWFRGWIGGSCYRRDAGDRVRCGRAVGRSRAAARHQLKKCLGQGAYAQGEESHGFKNGSVDPCPNFGAAKNGHTAFHFQFSGW